LSLLANKIQSAVDKTEEGIAKQSTARKSLSTKRVMSPPAETALTPSADNESLDDVNKTISPKKNQRGSRQKLLVTPKDNIKEDTNSVETASSTDISQAAIKLGAARGPRSKLLKTAARQSTIASISDSAVTDSSCDESNSKRSRRQANCVNDKVSKSGGLSILSSDNNDEVSSVPANSSNIEKPVGGGRQRCKVAGKSVAVSIQPLHVYDTRYLLSPGSNWLQTLPSVLFRHLVS
jgi:hypothetical protein